jgi:hypothetical protein
VTDSSRPWRILPCTIPSRSADFRTQPDACTAAQDLANQGTDIRIYHWVEREGWLLHEIVHPPAPSPDREDSR